MAVKLQGVSRLQLLLALVAVGILCITDGQRMIQQLTLVDGAEDVDGDYDGFESFANESTSESFANESTSLEPWFELKVPFYIYDTPELNWENATINGTAYEPDGLTESAFNAKHDDDYYFLKAAMIHPMRTKNPKEAKLFYVPALMNAVLERGSGFQPNRANFCVNDRCFRRGRNRRHKLIWMVDEALGKSPYFQSSNGKDHIVTLSHFSSRGLTAETTNVHKCNSIIFEQEITKGAEQFPDRIRVPGMYIGNPCPLVQKTHDFSMIASLRNSSDIQRSRQRLFRSRRVVCEALANQNRSFHTCGKGAQCPALAASKYGFHVRGDTWGSNRLMDTLMSGTIPLFTSEEQYNVLPPFYPWRNVSYLVDADSESSLRTSIDQILSEPVSSYEAKLKVIKDYMFLLDHNQPYMFDRFMTVFARKLGLQV